MGGCKSRPCPPNPTCKPCPPQYNQLITTVSQGATTEGTFACSKGLRQHANSIKGGNTRTPKAFEEAAIGAGGAYCANVHQLGCTSLHVSVADPLDGSTLVGTYMCPNPS